ncbi:MAG: DUF2919 family protein [Gammaproteobacteria bacterium]|nr:DUF2919 family protein [Gammaproteobacteria bacterium]
MTKQLLYRPQDFTEDGVLRIGFLLWAVLVFLNRHLILLLFGAVTSFVGGRFGLDSSGLNALYSNPWFLLSGLPAVAVLIAALRRDRKAGGIIRRLWRHGRWLLLISAGVDLLLLITLGMLTRADINLLHILGGVLDSYVLLYLYRSAWVRVRFADFPAAQEKSGS